MIYRCLRFKVASKLSREALSRDTLRVLKMDLFDITIIIIHQNGTFTIVASYSHKKFTHKIDL